jgi:hypothetical protein
MINKYLVEIDNSVYSVILSEAKNLGKRDTNGFFGRYALSE